MASNLPSSFSRGSGAQPSSAYSPSRISPPPLQSQQPSKGQAQQESDSNMPLMLAGLALMLSLASLYGAFFAERPLSASQKDQIAGIANDLRSLQNREIQMSAPLQTTIHLNKTYPIRDMFPETFEIPLDFEIPIDTQLVAVSTTGQPVAFRVQENVPIKVRIPIKSAKAFGNNSVMINKDMPLEAVWSSSIRVRAAYGQDLNGIIDKLEAIAGEASPIPEQ